MAAARAAETPEAPRGGRQGIRGFDPSLLRRAREKAGLRPKELAAASGVPLQSLKEYEGGRRVPQVSAAAALARALGGSPLEFVAGSADTPTTLRSLRVGSGLSQAEVGQRAGLGRTTYQQLESGRTATLIEGDAEALATAYGVDPADVSIAHAETRRQFLINLSTASGRRGRRRAGGGTSPAEV